MDIDLDRIRKYSWRPSTNARPRRDMSDHMVESLYRLYVAHHTDATVKVHKKTMEGLKARGLAALTEENAQTITPKGVAFVDGVLWGLGFGLLDRETAIEFLGACEKHRG